MIRRERERGECHTKCNNWSPNPRWTEDRKSNFPLIRHFTSNTK
jgi:hypothetical protein